MEMLKWLAVIQVYSRASTGSTVMVGRLASRMTPTAHSNDAGDHTVESVVENGLYSLLSTDMLGA